MKKLYEIKPRSNFVDVHSKELCSRRQSQIWGLIKLTRWRTWKRCNKCQKIERHQKWKVPAKHGTEFIAPYHSFQFIATNFFPFGIQFSEYDRIAVPSENITRLMLSISKWHVTLRGPAARWVRWIGEVKWMIYEESVIKVENTIFFTWVRHYDCFQV